MAANIAPQWDESDYLYSPELDLLIDLGQVAFQELRESARAQELAAAWQELCQAADWQASLQSGWENFQKQVKVALTCLGANADLNLDEETADEVRSALTVLDRVVLLALAVEDRPQGELTESFIAAVIDLANRVTTEEAPQTIRLIPVNQYRRAVLQSIPGKYHYLFPWYTEWVELPDDTLELMVACWGGSALNEAPALSEIDPADLHALLQEITADQTMFRALQKQAKFRKTLRKALINPAWRLLALGEQEAANHHVSAFVRQEGLEKIARLASEDTVSNDAEINRLDQAFRWALCGPQSLVSNQPRLDTFNEVLAVLKTLDPAILPLGSALEKLAQWSQNRITDQEFAGGIFSQWAAGLRRAAVKVKLERVWAGLSNRWERFCESMAWQILLRQTAPVYLGEEPAQELTSLQIQNPIEASLRQVGESYPLLHSPELNIPDDYSNLYNFLIQAGRFYWTGWVFKRAAAEPERIPPGVIGRGGLPPCYELPADDYALVILALTTRREPLQQFIDQVEAGTATFHQPIEGVVVIFFTPENEQAGHEQV